MKRLAVLLFLAFLFWGIAPAYGNTITPISITCDHVAFSWVDFPSHPVTLTVTVTQDATKKIATFDTHGERAGEGTVPVDLHSGSATASVSWTLRKTHTAGPVTADLHCTPTTTSPPPTTTTTTTTAPRVPKRSTFRMIPPVTADCGPGTLACTGTASTGALLVGGWLAVAFGAALVWGARTRRDEQ